MANKAAANSLNTAKAKAAEAAKTAKARNNAARPSWRHARAEGLRTSKLLWTAGLLLIAGVLSAAKPVVLPDGGAVTYFSLLFLWLVTFFFGPKWGLGAGLVFGFVKLFVTYITGETVNWAIGALILEYPLACAVFALGAVALGRRARTDADGLERDGFGLRVGYLIGVAAMGVCYVVSAVLFYPPDVPGFFPNLLYCIKYDFSYLIIEAAVTLVLLAIPPVVDAIHYLRHLACTPVEDPTLKGF
ncbi:MAG: energy-coupled thiamine transporter ThiT [Eggerthellaceae bacterium]|nr:energy-coupled thiamine transporter ThiT [Eggerthellaceae bacterium]MBR3258968.1 energy-coupled thiamine transporter ThiT [Eggerthellaceae bacterium]